jgi:hypothetical protein
MTWALGQHPNIFPLEETHFVYKLAVDLDYLYEVGARQGHRSVIGMAQLTRRELRVHFGRACDDLIVSSRSRIARHASSGKFRDQHTENIKLKVSEVDPKRRWIDGTPENAHYVLSLWRMYPEAKFIHILRNPRQVASSLMHFSAAGATDYPEEEAYRIWSWPHPTHPLRGYRLRSGGNPTALPRVCGRGVPPQVPAAAAGEDQQLPLR